MPGAAEQAGTVTHPAVTQQDITAATSIRETPIRTSLPKCRPN
jgi:hypothetical protein